MPRDGQRRDVVLLPEDLRGIHDLLYLGTRRQHRRQPLEAEQLSLAVARLEDAVGIECQRLTLLQPEAQLVIDNAARKAKRQGARKRQLFAIAERRKMPGIRHRGLPIGSQVQHHAGDEAALDAPDQTPVQSLQNLRGLQRVVGQRAQGAYDQRDRHRRLQPFAAYIADDHQRVALRLRHHLEEIAAHLRCRLVDAGNRIARNRRRLLRNQHVLYLPCRLDLHLDLRLAAAFHELLAADREQQHDEQQQVQQKGCAEGISADVDAPCLHVINQRPVREPPALSGKLKGQIVGAVKKRGDRYRPQRPLSPAHQPEAHNEKNVDRRQCINRRRDRIGPLQSRTGILPREECRYINRLRNQIEGRKNLGPASPPWFPAQPKERQQQQPQRDVLD